MSLHDQPGTAAARLRVTQPAVHASAKGLLDPNAGKPLAISIEGETWARIPLRTGLFDRGDDLGGKMARVLRLPSRPLSPIPTCRRGSANAGTSSSSARSSRSPRDARSSPGRSSRAWQPGCCPSS